MIAKSLKFITRQISRPTYTRSLQKSNLMWRVPRYFSSAEKAVEEEHLSVKIDLATGQVIPGTE